MDFAKLKHAEGQDGAKAFQILISGEVPKDMISIRKGRGSETFSYIKHAKLTALLQEALGAWWSWDILETGTASNRRVDKTTGEVVGEDKTAWARGCLTVYIEEDDCVLPVTLTELGPFDNTFDLTDANARASAASRALARAIMRRFGFGMEFYPDSELPVATAVQAWRALKNFAAENDVTEEVLVKKLQAEGIQSKQLADREVFARCWTLVEQMGGEGLFEKPTKPAGDTPVPSAEPPEAPEEEDIQQVIVDAADDLETAIAAAVAGLEQSTEPLPAMPTVESWPEFYGEAIKTGWGYRQPSDVIKDLTTTFQSRDRPQMADGKPDFQRMWNALTAYREAKKTPEQERDKALEDVLKKYKLG